MFLLLFLSSILIFIQGNFSYKHFPKQLTRSCLKMSSRNDARLMIIISSLGLSLTLSGCNISPVNADTCGCPPSVTLAKRIANAVKIVEIGRDVNMGNFAPFQIPETKIFFESYISSSPSQEAITEKRILSKIFNAVKRKDSGNLKLAYSDFLEVSNLDPLYSPKELKSTVSLLE